MSADRPDPENSLSPSSSNRLARSVSATSRRSPPGTAGGWSLRRTSPVPFPRLLPVVMLMGVLIAIPSVAVAGHSTTPTTVAAPAHPEDRSFETIQPVAPSVPLAAAAPPHGWSAVVDDVHDGYLLAVGASSSQGTVTNTTSPATVQTWALLAGNWTPITPVANPSTRVGESLVYDPTLGAVLLFGGRYQPNAGAGTYPRYLNDTWSFQGGAWTNITAAAGAAPPVRSDAVIAYDPSLSGALLFGGFGPTGNRTDTWLFGGVSWSNQTGLVAPPDGGAMAAYPPTGAVLYFGGGLPAGGFSDQTWSFAGGRWTNVTTSVGPAPSPRSGPAMAWDPASNEIVLFGGYGGTDPATHAWLVLGDTWAFSGGVWTQLSPATTPPARVGGLLVPDPSGAGLDLLGGWTSAPGVPGDLWGWTAGTWTPDGPVLIPTRAVSDVDLPLTFSVRAIVPVGSPTFAYSGLPPGCTAVDAAAITCTPTAPGSYTISVAVTAAGIAPLASQTALDLNALPQVATIRLSSPTATVGAPVALSVVATGGTGPLRFAYAGLPTGCASGNTSTLSCTPAATGSSTVTVSVTDALGQSAQATLAVTVLPAGAVTSLPPWAEAPFWVGFAATLAVFAVGAALVVARSTRRRRGDSLQAALERRGPEFFAAEPASASADTDGDPRRGG